MPASRLIKVSWWITPIPELKTGSAISFRRKPPTSKWLDIISQSNLSALLQRNQLRQGKERIPEAGIRAAYNKLQIPTLGEGFDKLYYVKIDPQGSFVVEEWQDEV